jgi:hypothetical protein
MRMPFQIALQTCEKIQGIPNCAHITTLAGAFANFPNPGRSHSGMVHYPCYILPQSDVLNELRLNEQEDVSMRMTVAVRRALTREIPTRERVIVLGPTLQE